jgi:hypothetical protein
MAAGKVEAQHGKRPGRLHRRPPSNGPMNLPVAFGRPQVIGRTFDSRKDR